MNRLDAGQILRKADFVWLETGCSSRPDGQTVKYPSPAVSATVALNEYTAAADGRSRPPNIGSPNSATLKRDWEFARQARQGLARRRAVTCS